MSILPRHLVKRVELIQEKHPDLECDVIEDIVAELSDLFNIPPGFNHATFVESQLCLTKNYFSYAIAHNIEIKAQFYRKGKTIFVRLDDEIQQLLNQNYICTKINKEESDEYDIVISLSSKTLLGFYK